MALFQKNENPVNKVVALRQQGLTDNQIIQTLQQEGMNSQQVLEALEAADARSPMPAPLEPLPQMPPAMKPQSIVPPMQMPPPMGQMGQMPPPMGQMPGPMGFQSMQNPQNPKQTDEEVEELIEAIIEEKWQQIEKDITKVLKWKDTVDEKIGGLQADVKNLSKDFDDLHKAILGKVTDYDKNITNVGTQLKAMEQAFSKVLPTLVDNVNELERIASKMKK